MWMITVVVAILGVTTLQAQQVYMDNVVILLDASGSMDDMMRGSSIRKIDAAKAAIREVLRQTPPTTQLGLLVFGSRRGWEFPLGPRNDAAMSAAISRIEAESGTPLGEFMKIAADRLLEARKEQFGYGSYRLLVVTDGEATDPILVDRFTPDIRSRGIVIDVIGVDMQQNHTLAHKVHSYRRADDPRALSQAIREVLAEVGSATDGLAGGQAFEELNGLPMEAATAIITAFASTGNHGIGTKAGDPVVTHVPEVVQTPVAAPVSSAPDVEAEHDRGFRTILLALLIVGGISIVNLIFKR